MLDKLLIIDFGSQVTQLIARRVRECAVYAEIHPFMRVDEAFLQHYKPKAIILSGGPSSVLDADAPLPDASIFAYNVPIFGICYGQQILAHMLGGKLTHDESREFGKAFVTPICAHHLFDGFWQQSNDYQVWMSHGDAISALPNGFKVLAQSAGAPYAIIGDDTRQYYGAQFHPEVTHTTQGKELLQSFLYNICGFKGDWKMDAFCEEQIATLKNDIGDAHVICGLSGGVDSAVAAVLVHRAIGKKLHCIFVDHGLLRLNEAEQVLTLFKQHYDINLIHVNAEDIFLSALKDISDPEQKRKIIGKLFIDIFEAEAKKIEAQYQGAVEFLVQGTLYPDVIESISLTSGNQVTIKSHHNVGGLPERMQLKLIEPLRHLFKDEVRLLGYELGLPEAFIKRHPFPGPGLAIRIPGAIDKDKCNLLRQADAIFIESLKEHGLYDEIWQAFAVLLPTQTVGVMGDARTYEYVLALRAVTSLDGMSADIYHFSSEYLSHLSTKLINEVQGINRVVYDYTSKPPGTIEWE